MISKYLSPNTGELVELLGEPRVFKLTPSENGGAYLQFESTHAPGRGAPPHWHRDEDEAFYVLAGQYTFSVEAEHFTAPAGAFAFVPRGAVHTFTNSGPEQGRMLITVTPGTGHEGLFRAVEALTREAGQPPEGRRLVALAEHYGWVLAPAPR